MQEQEFMLVLKEVKIEKKLSIFQKIGIIVSIEHLHRANYKSNNTLPCIIPKIWYGIVRVNLAFLISVELC